MTSNVTSITSRKTSKSKSVNIAASKLKLTDTSSPSSKKKNVKIIKKIMKPGLEGVTQGVQRVRYTAFNVFLPYGREEYNDNLILNAIINDSTNLNHNLITTLKKIIRTFEGLRDTDQGRYKYSIN